MVWDCRKGLFSIQMPCMVPETKIFSLFFLKLIAMFPDAYLFYVYFGIIYMKIPGSRKWAIQEMSLPVKYFYFCLSLGGGGSKIKQF